MLPGGLDPLYRLALARGHQPRLRIEVWKDGERVDTLVPASLQVGAPGLKYQSASVNATLTSKVARKLTMDVHEELYPANAGDLLTEDGTQLRAFRGIDFADGSSYEWQTFVGKISTVGLSDSGGVRVEALDPADEVIANGFETPQNSQIGAQVQDEIVRLIHDRLPTATFGTSDETDQLVPAMTYEFDPGKALDDLATSMGAFWYPLATGEFVVRLYPWSQRTAPIVTLSDGPGGTVVGSAVQRSRAGVVNAVTVTGERSDGNAPVFATEEDTNPASRTYVGGQFGRRSKLVQLSTPITQQNADFAARQLLKRLSALTEAWSINVIPDAALELGDTVSLNVRGRTGIVQVVAGYTIPMDVGGTMQVKLRAQIVDQLSDQGGD